MKNYLFFVSLGAALFFSFSTQAQINASDVKNGDIVFIITPSGQGKAIQLATHSKYTHVGIIFIENGVPVVYHAVEPVSKNTLQEFIGMSVGGEYVIKRLRDQAPLTNGAVATMRNEAQQQLGKHYDLYFGWGDDRLYCSEYVWKLYNHALHLEVGPLKPLRSFDLSDRIVKQIMQKRYGNDIPLDEKMISPGDMFNSELLE